MVYTARAAEPSCIIGQRGLTLGNSCPRSARCVSVSLSLFSGVTALRQDVFQDWRLHPFSKSEGYLREHLLFDRWIYFFAICT